MVDDDEDDLEQSMGFMFDASRAKSIVVITPKVPDAAPIRLRLIKGNPGHVQSGQYLWPAAQFAATWLLTNCAALALDSSHRLRVVELGAGCGLAGLAMLQLENVDTVVFTDYDYGSIELLNENVNEAKSQPYAAGKTLAVERLKWGSETLSSTLLSIIGGEGEMAAALLVIGTDLIYSKDVVQPLLQSVKLLLVQKQPGAARFVLFSSFDISDYDAEVSRVCGMLKIQVCQLEPLIPAAAGETDAENTRRSRVQLFSLCSSIVL